MQISEKACIVYMRALSLFSKANAQQEVKWKLWIVDFFSYPGGDLGHCQNLMESMLDQEPSSHFFHEDLTNSIYVILLADKRPITSRCR